MAFLSEDIFIAVSATAYGLANWTAAEMALVSSGDTTFVLIESLRCHVFIRHNIMIQIHVQLSSDVHSTDTCICRFHNIFLKMVLKNWTPDLDFTEL